MDQIESAYEHLMEELLLPQMKSSLRIDFEKAKMAHDSIHEFMFLPAKTVEDSENYSFKTNSLYFLHQWEIFDHATRSNLDALSTFYNSAFIHLRIILELMIKGVFFDCLAHKKFRDNTSIIESDKKERGKNLKLFLAELIKRSPQVEEGFENISVSIFDKLEDYLYDRNNTLSISLMLKQAISWGIFDGVENAESLIYGMYGRLSLDVHITPNNMDMGRTLLTGRKLFKKREVMPEYLKEYFDTLHTIMDICIVSFLNILNDNIRSSDTAKKFLKEHLEDNHFVSLKLGRTESRIRKLIND